MKKLVILMLLAMLAGCKTTQQYSTINPALSYLPVGEWRLNDSRQKVSSLSSLPNLKPVELTGGFETSNGTFNGETKNISFVFDDKGLAYSQIWLYEGHDIEEATREFSKLFTYFEKHLGGAIVKGFEASEGFSTEAVETVTKLVFNQIQTAANEMNKEASEKVCFELTLDMIPVTQAVNNRLHGTFFYSSVHKTFFVFLFEDRPSAPARDVENHVNVFKQT